MALSEEGGGGIPATMLVGPATMGNTVGGYPVYMGGGQSNGNGFGDNGWWIILLFILLALGNWGGQNNGGGFGGGTPIVINDGGNGGNVQRGFDQAAIMGGLNGIQTGVQGLSTQLCNCCCDMRDTVNQGFASAEIADNARQMANMQQMFSLQSQFADCCCENRLATADLKYTIAQENCADRYANAQNTRDIIENDNRNNQLILDKLCQLELDAKNDEIAQLRQEVLYARGQASQIAQNQQIVDSIYNRLDTCPVGTTPVYGRTPIFTCNNNSCGCGCGNF